MSKQVVQTHITGERGVIRFWSYCNQHEPYIMFREVTRNDFGIDGEVEFVLKNELGKREATGEILKIQIKSTEGFAGYISRETDKIIEFRAKKEDLEYWSKFKVDVLLVLYDNKTDSLFCKKIEQPKITKALKSYPIEFDKIKNKLELGVHDFKQKFSTYFTTRLSYDRTEQVATNLYRFKANPKIIYKYPSLYKNKKSLFNNYQTDFKYFIIYNEELYSFVDLERFKPDFHSKVVKPATSKGVISFSEIVQNRDLKSHYIEIINIYFKELLWEKHMKYDKNHKRYFFTKPKHSDEYRISHRTLKLNRESDLKVVGRYEYGRDIFYRHHALSISYQFIENTLYAIFEPKYHYTKDGIDTLEPHITKKYAIRARVREFNKETLNFTHLFFDYLSNEPYQISLQNYEGVVIKLSNATILDAGFSIETDITKNRVKEPEAESNQIALF